MDEKSANVVSLDKITPSAVFEHLKSRKYIDNIYKDILERMKDTHPYKRMRDVAVTHMSGILVDNSKDIPGPEDRLEKKKQIAEIGILALSIQSTISALVSEKLKKEAPTLINNTFRELMRTELKRSSDSETDSPKKRNKNSPQKNASKFKEYRNTNPLADTDKESITSKRSVSMESVSSVHTSDLSSFDEEVELSEEEGGSRKKVKVSLKAAKLSFPDSLPAQQKRVQRTRAKSNQKAKAPPTTKPSTSFKKSITTGDAPQRMRSKRMRKLNSRYSSDTILITNSVLNPRYNERLDVESDLKLINEGHFSKIKTN